MSMIRLTIAAAAIAMALQPASASADASPSSGPFSGPGISFAVAGGGIVRKEMRVKLRCQFSGGSIAWPEVIGQRRVRIPVKAGRWSARYRIRRRVARTIEVWHILEDRGRFVSPTRATGTFRATMTLLVPGIPGHTPCRGPRMRWTATLRQADLRITRDARGRFVIANVGRAGAGPFDLRVADPPGPLAIVQTVHFDHGLKVGQRALVTVPCAPGRTLTLDPANQVVESDEGNNTLACPS